MEMKRLELKIEINKKSANISKDQNLKINFYFLFILY